MDMETEGTNLPWELIIEIFSRLPVKSLMRFRSVSKPCCSLVTEPHFINKHLYQSTQNSLKSVILSPSLDFQKHLVSCPLSSLSRKPIGDAAKLIYPMKDKSTYVRLWDSCDGLFCIEITRDVEEGLLLSDPFTSQSQSTPIEITGDDEVGLLLWNPSTRQSKSLPYTPIEIPYGFDQEQLTFGYALGFDSLNNDYKVLRLATFNNFRETKTETDMYSLNTNSWRKLDGFRWSSSAVSFDCKYVNGAFHWLAFRQYAEEESTLIRTQIISLNTFTENFGEVPLPNLAVLKNSYTRIEANLAVLRGMLCVYLNNVEQSFVLWVMKDYGHQESWEKIFHIPYDVFYCLFRPMYLYENGEILLVAYGSKRGLVTYKKNRYGFKKVVARGLDRIKEAHVYVESLISPP